MPVVAEVAALQADLRATVLEVRRVVEGLRPPALDELGLVDALTQVLAGSPSGTGVSADGPAEPLPALPAAVEVAAFRIATEAVTNVVRHAGATDCESWSSSVRRPAHDGARQRKRVSYGLDPG